MRRLRTDDFDLDGNSFFRVLKFNLVDKLLPIGNFRAGTGLKPGLVLLFLHWFGRPLFKVLIRYEPHLHRLYLKLGRSK